jgi:hypothetical protein
MKHSGLHHRIGLRERLKNGLLLGILRRTVTPGLLRRMDARETRRALASPEARNLRRMFCDLRPSLVFSPAPLHAEEWLPIQVARDMGIRTALAVLSWDNLSTKSRLPLPVDRILVWSDQMARELTEYYPGIPPGTVHVTGAPQFDYYFLAEYEESRETFFRRFGGDPTRPLIVYAGVTPSLVPEEPRIVEELAASLSRGEVAGNPQLLIRLHPKDGGGRYAAFRTGRSGVFLMVPGERSGGNLKTWQPDPEDMRLLAGTMRHGDVHINIASTMTLDAAILDRPVINVRYLPGAAADALPWGMQGYEMTHYRPLMDTGGFRMAASHAELLKEISRYLADPARERSERRRMVELVCGTPDGHAGERAARALIPLISGEAG